ncbi:MAG: BspA family leucine-rich repeat surface protein, partial [Campylobacterales bacterium]|nr:BspA family leucine-rich repeat surface protein [Campylobacterales bacterium]
MKKILITLAISLNLLSNDFYLSNNGLTIKCENANLGDTGTVGSTTYKKISNLSELNINGGSVDASIACTSGITDISRWFLGKNSFNKDISHWDTSSVTDMTEMFKNSSFNQDISLWSTPKILSKPTNFDTNSPFENQNNLQPQWGYNIFGNHFSDENLTGTTDKDIFYLDRRAESIDGNSGNDT